MPFTLPPLPYANDALEPHIDAKTMEIHHDEASPGVRQQPQRGDRDKRPSSRASRSTI